MTKLLRSITLITSIFLSSAANSQQQVNIFWFEDASCAAWAKSAGNRLIRLQYEFWIRGFASGHNYANPSRQVATGKLPGGDQLHAYLDNYCLDNPNSSFIGGAFRLVEQFREPTAPVKSSPTKDASKAPPPAAVK